MQLQEESYQLNYKLFYHSRSCTRHRILIFFLYLFSFIIFSRDNKYSINVETVIYGMQGHILKNYAITVLYPAEHRDENKYVKRNTEKQTDMGKGAE